MSHENYFVPAGQLMLSLPKSNYNLTFHRDGQEIGKLDFNGPEMVFTGDAEESAKVFIDWIARSFSGRLAEERAAQREALAAEAERNGNTILAMQIRAWRQA